MEAALPQWELSSTGGVLATFVCHLASSTLTTLRQTDYHLPLGQAQGDEVTCLQLHKLVGNNKIKFQRPSTISLCLSQLQIILKRQLSYSKSETQF